MTTTEPSVEDYLKELRAIFRWHVSIKVTECSAPGCVAYRYEIEVPRPNIRFHATTLDEAMDQVRAWHAEQAKES